MHRKVIYVIISLLFISFGLIAQDFDPYQAYAAQRIKKNVLREILNKFSIHFTFGYGRNFYNHQLNNYGLINTSDSLGQGLFIFNSADSSVYSPVWDPVDSIWLDNPFSGVRNWLNNPVSADLIRYENQDTDELTTNNKPLNYRGTSGTIPFTISIQYNFMERFRLGGGFTYEFHRLPTMTPSYGEEIVGKYIPDKKISSFKRYFVTVGGKFYQFMDWSYFLDFQLGRIFNYGGAFNKSVMTNSLYYNIGVPIEYEFSEYFRVYVRPSYEFKNYTINMGELGTVLHHHPTFFVHFGFRYNIPEIPRCPIRADDPPGSDYPKNFTNKTCRIQKKHIHGNRAFRGQPFYKKQNPKIGENHPNLLKYRLFNRRKISGGY